MGTIMLNRGGICSASAAASLTSSSPDVARWLRPDVRPERRRRSPAPRRVDDPRAVPAGYVIDWSSIDRTSWPISVCSEHPAPDPDVAPAVIETSHHHMGAAATGTAPAGHVHGQLPADDHGKADEDESWRLIRIRGSPSRRQGSRRPWRAPPSPFRSSRRAGCSPSS